MDLNSTGLRPHLIWWTLLRERGAQVAAFFPDTLVGTVQFEVESDGEVACFFLQLDGPHTECGQGRAPTFTTLVEATDEGIADLLSGNAHENVFRISGDRDLFTRYLTLLSSQAPARNAIQLRASL